MTVVAGVGVFGGAAAEVPSGGSSTFLLVAAWTGMLSSGAECANGLVRLGLIARHPHGSQLEALDNNKIYAVSVFMVDAIGQAAGIATLPAGIKNLYAILLRQHSFAAKRLSEEALRQMNRVQRAKVISELVADATRTPEGLEAVVAAAREAGVGAKSIQGAELSVRNATRMTGVIAEETVKRLHRTVASVLSVPIGFGISAMPASIVGGAASGSVNYIVNLIDTGG
jgi:hypothetical protein